MVVAAVADEEHASLGVQEVLGSVTADAAIVTEPTERELIVAHKGFVWIEIEVEGRAAHGSRYEEGVDAIVKAGPMLTGIGELDDRARRAHAPAARPRLGARLADRRRRRAVELPGALHDRARAPHAAGRDGRAGRGRDRGADREGRASLRTALVREPFAVDPEAEIVRAVLEAAGGPELAGAPTGPTRPSSPPPASRP